MKRRGKYYVENKEMLAELKELEKTDVISESLHLMFYKMAKKVGTKARFSGYTWIDDMTSDAYLKCCNKARKFDTTRDNPFAYFTTVIIHYFWDALNAENRQKKIKDRMRDDQLSRIYHRFGITFKVGQKHD